MLFDMSLYLWVKRRSSMLLYGSAFTMVDGSWAMSMSESMSEFRSGSDGLSVMLGSGLSMYAAWILRTAVGMVGGDLSGTPPDRLSWR